MNDNLCSTKKENIGVSDINDSLKSILIDKMRMHLLKKTRTLPINRSEVENYFTDDFVSDLKDMIDSYWRIVYETNAKCAVSKGQFVDMYMARDSA